uniref:Glycerol-3-phosphate dehydrogenase n=1 Tax=Setaria digitata TaxID=48799 RepID=A0A915Q298_9BILA
MVSWRFKLFSVPNRLVLRRLLIIGSGGATVATAFSLWQINLSGTTHFRKVLADNADIHIQLNKRLSGQLPTRKDLIRSLKNDQFDVLVIGGGATGAGVALDSQTRGLKTALVELDDFSSGTSSRSTKLIHGGVRYLQAAIFGLDIEQYRMVKEALFERANLIHCAPHLSYPLPIMLPIYKLWQVPYYWFGIKAYDLVSGRRVLKKSYYINKTQALELFPMLKKESLVGALMYYDGQHNDARMNIAIILSAIRHGAKAVNHVKVSRLLKNAEGMVCGAHVVDNLTGEEWNVKAKAVVNATGPFTDSVRLMADPDTAPICQPSAGVHIVLPGYYSPSSTGLLDPSTSDGRVIFFLPWQRMTVAGTTDAPVPLTFHPSPNDVDIEFILREIRHYLSSDVSVRRGDVMSAWSGLRPLVRDPNKKDTKSLARNHVIEVSKSGLVTIAGGKWTTYRHMAEETVDKVVEVANLQPVRGCVTAGLLLEGAHNWDPLLYIRLVQDYGLDEDVARHLSSTYGDRAFAVARMSKITGKRWPIIGHRLHSEFPYVEAEVKYAVKEYACTAVDVIARRLRLAFLNTYAAYEVLDKVVDIMGEELQWTAAEKKKQLENARVFIEVEMGQNARLHSVSSVPISLTAEEMEVARERFRTLDKENKGHITLNDLRRHFRLYSGLKGGQIAQNRLARYLDEFEPTPVSVLRSGGGI